MCIIRGLGDRKEEIAEKGGEARLKRVPIGKSWGQRFVLYYRDVK